MHTYTHIGIYAGQSIISLERMHGPARTRPIGRLIRHATPLDIAVRSTLKKPSDRSLARLNRTWSSSSYCLNQSSLATASGENLVRTTLLPEFKLLASSEFSLLGIRGTSWQSCCIRHAFEPSVFGLRLHCVGSFSNPSNEALAWLVAAGNDLNVLS